MSLGPPIKPPKPEEPEWKPYPGDPKRMEVNAKGQLRTKIPPPPVK